jgi:HK97 family phage portal protein
MAWNSPQNKSLENVDKKSIGPGAPVAQNPSYVGKPYRDNWDIERAYREGMQKVTWVSRCIDAIAGNQARLPIILRKDNSPDGEVVKGKAAARSTLLEVLNTKSNIGENSFVFRYRLSSQLLLGTRGAFIEKVKGRDGRIIGLNLLPPQSTSPIPDPKKFVSGYEVSMPYGQKVFLKPEDVCWIRRPHPLDPYLSLTPLESAGVAVEIENLAKIYNRNYLMNDGRPGGLLVLRGEIDDDDKEELRSRFRGNLSRAGATSVISSDDGVDYVDTSANPRDAAYIQMRQITKEEILASFGVPESVIGNASGRTFSNASEEIRVFWMETMLPHLEVLARALDELDDDYYIDFNTEEVPILMLYRQERQRYLMDEFNAGLISNNEYRIGSGRRETESDLADSLLLNPNLIPISNTKKKMEEPAQATVPGAPMGAAGAMPPVVPGAPGAVPAVDEQGNPLPANPLDPNTMAGALAAVSGEQPQIQEETPPTPEEGELAQTALPEPEPEEEEEEEEEAQIQATNNKGIQTKSLDDLQEIERWEEILGRSIERVLERQQRVVLEKSSGIKAKKSLMAGTLDINSVVSVETWDKQMDEDIKPVIAAIIKDSKKTNSQAFTEKSTDWLNEADTRVQIDAQMLRIKQINQDIKEEISRIMFTSLNITGEEERASAFRSSIISMYTDILAKRKFETASDETRRAWKFADKQ